MYSVTRRIAKIKQPYGGFIKRTDFSAIQINDKRVLHNHENINPGLVGLSVDYMTRYLMGTPIEESFRISCRGAQIAKDEKNANELLKMITGLNRDSVSAACKLVGYDVCLRAGMKGYKPVSEIMPNDKTIDNIITMINRSLEFWRDYGPIVLDGFTFDGGYTPIISSGDGDYLTKDTLWDFKVSKKEPDSYYTLQLLVYYIMGLHSVHKEFLSVNYLGFFNPRLNKVYRLPVKLITDETIKTVSHDVIGYGWTKAEYIDFLEKQIGLRTVYKDYKVGDIVNHEVFGRGKVLSSTPFGSDTMLQIAFDKVGTKLLMLNFAKAKMKRIE